MFAILQSLLKKVLEKGKTEARAVWGYPAIVTFGEAIFAVPLIKGYMKGGTPVTHRREIGCGDATELLQKETDESYLAIDSNSFDLVVPKWLIRAAFDILFFNVLFLNYQGFPCGACGLICPRWYSESVVCIMVAIASKGVKFNTVTTLLT